MILLVVYAIFLLLLAVYSYSLLDPNITFFSSPVWELFRNFMVDIGYHQRELSSLLFVIAIVGLFVFYYLFIQQKRHFKNPFIIAIVISSLLVISYPFLSHDLFNYMFDAKIATFYHQNPYLHKALDFPQDPWVRFMHWTHRTYPYGPTFLLISLIPSLLSFGKFLLSFILFKITFIVFYLAAVWILQKKDKLLALQFATHPLVIVEGLINAHNDLIGISLVIIGIYFLYKKKDITSRIFFLISVGIKYVTIPYLFMTRNSKMNFFGVLGVIVLMIGWVTKMEIQPWYFLLLFGLLPLYKEYFDKLTIFFAGLLLSYYPYIRYGEWSTGGNVEIKHWIIIIFAVVNALYVFFTLSRKKFLRR